ncbi:MAG: beta-propeller fold lactonase family protein [Gammaproteobacteria bacterium]|nr:beta-propeller fold lactonase family protein [Gammaproteobacteria bacterium]
MRCVITFFALILATGWLTACGYKNYHSNTSPNTRLFAYISNASNSTLSLCPVSMTDGSLGTCTTTNGNATFQRPLGMSINPSISLIYITNFTNSTISICPINSDDSLGTCTTTNANGTLSNPDGIALNSTGTFAYISSVSNNTVATCPINSDGSFGTCTASNGNGTFSAPQAINLNEASTFAYISNGNASMSICPINGNGSLGTCTTSTGNGTFQEPQGLSFNETETFAYAGNYISNNLSICAVNSTDGSLSACTTTTGNGTFNFSVNQVIGLFMSSPSHFGYIPNDGNDTVSICPINADSSLATCVTTSGNGTFSQPSAVVMTQRN